MKTKTILVNTIILSFLLIFVLPVKGGTMRERQEIITKEISVTPATSISFENKTGDVTVNTWEKNAVRVEIRIVIDGDDEEVEKVLDILRKIDFSKSSEQVSFNTRFYKMMSGNFPGSFKVTLSNGVTARLKKLDLFYTLTVPRGNALNMANAYRKLNLPDLAGKTTLDLYECDLTGKSIAAETKLKLKYGKASFDSLKDAGVDLYEASLTIGGAGDLTIGAKYSSLTIASAGILKIDAYEDKIAVKQHGDVSVTAKYTTLELGGFNRGTFDLYECRVKAGDANIVAVGAKYCELEFKSCRALVFTSSYENKFSSAIVGDFKATSSYGNYKIGQLQGKLTFTESYEDKINVMKIAKSFGGLQLDGKYSEIVLTFDPGVVYKIDADTRYTDFDFNKEAFREIRYHKENDEFKYLAVIKGGDEATAPEVKLKMYEGKVEIRQ
jgi:hypothetical protein